MPDDARAIFIMAHGAGAGMDHVFMETMTHTLVEKKIGVIRFNFPYMERGKRLPSNNNEDVHALADVFNQVERKFDLPIFCGGKSYGGRMASHAAAEGLLNKSRGLIFLGFPLHSPGKENTKRGLHIHQITQPMLFLQGFKDKLANPNLLKQLLIEMTNTKLIFFQEADHSFKVPKKSLLSQDELMETLAIDISDWITGVTRQGPF